MLGGLARYLREADPNRFQPMNSNFGLLDELDERVRDKRARRERMAERSLLSLDQWMAEHRIDAADAPGTEAQTAEAQTIAHAPAEAQAGRGIPA
jgi:hypothetical protein